MARLEENRANADPSVEALSKCSVADPKAKCGEKKMWMPWLGSKGMPIPGAKKLNPRSLAGASACMADDGQSVIVFGGLEVDKNPNAFGGDTLYSDELYWFSAQLDEEEGQIKPLGMHWYGPLPELSRRQTTKSTGLPHRIGNCPWTKKLKAC